MEVEFGQVQEYNTERGFGFVSRTFSNANQRHKKNVWFHIKKIKCDYPSLAKELDAGSFANINFWYEVDNSDREKVGKVWLDPKDIPQQQRDSLSSHIEELWCNPINAFPEWLDSSTIAVVGEVRKDELKKLYDERIRKRNEVKEQEKIQRQLRGEQAMGSNNQTQSSKDPVGGDRDDAKNIQIPSGTERFRTERGIMVAIFSSEMHGLPPELRKIVRPCPRGSRINPLSYDPGGSDVVVAYSLGHAILYDWIKDVERYISSFEKSNPEFHLHIQSIYGRFCEYTSERGFGVFSPIWYRDRDGACKDAIKACLKRYQTQIKIGHKTLHEEAKNYWKTTYGLSDQEVENLPTLYNQYKQYMEENRKEAMKARWERYQRKMDMRQTLHEKVSQESWEDDL
ncbi:hypothetical protein [Microcoleus sp. K5-D4]|uniref:hypothetical protein n=1 Tax=Microcoleus sp. K5-D4 TaxID=2818801 RepID=UPI002FD09995